MILPPSQSKVLPFPMPVGALTCSHLTRVNSWLSYITRRHLTQTKERKKKKKEVISVMLIYYSVGGGT